MDPLRKEGKQQRPLALAAIATGACLNGAPPKGGEAGCRIAQLRVQVVDASMEPLRKEGKQWGSTAVPAVRTTASMEPLRKEGKQPRRLEGDPVRRGAASMEPLRKEGKQAARRICQH